jgi:two-component system sensor histidine kinase/response regulator
MAKILLIDDDHDLSILTKTALVKSGHEVLVFHRALEALAEARKNRPDIILMDLMLPGMDGAEAASRLKTDPQMADIPVIFMTAVMSSRETILEEGSEIKVNGWNYKILGKPFEIDELLGLVEKALN